MGYACPVCGDPQADGEHLANHLAFTAMLGDADHEDWLDEHVPDWGDTDPTELAERVTDLADEREFPQVFEDTSSDGHDHSDHAHSRDSHGERGPGGHGGRGPGGNPHGNSVPDDVAPGGVADPSELFDDSDGERDPSDVLAEARELTEQRRTSADEGSAADDSKQADEDDETGGE